jgi:tetratricopeptide (TPR) repeat protein
LAAEIELVANNAAAAESVLRANWETVDGTTGFNTLAVFHFSRWLAEALYAQEQHDEAEEWAQRAKGAVAPDNPIAQIQVEGILAKILAQRGRLAEARSRAQASVSTARRTDVFNLRGQALRNLAEVLTLADEPKEAAAAAQEALRIYEKKGAIALVTNTRGFLEGLELRRSPTRAL